jgi:uncharacterized protein (DUF983 family)
MDLGALIVIVALGLIGIGKQALDMAMDYESSLDIVIAIVVICIIIGALAGG